jgi:hypothetical protein
MSVLTFDEATHTYRFGGNVVPGVTSILAPLTNFDRVPPHVLEAASNFGKAVHKACELDDLGELDEAALDPALVPYLQAWRKFSADHAVEWTVIEKPVYHPTMNYAGTPDRIGSVKGDLTVVDIKSTAQLYPSVGPQLSAYAHADGNAHAKRLAVQLKADGTYVAKPYTDPADFPVFASLLTLRNWCARNSITPNFKD